MDTNKVLALGTIGTVLRFLFVAAGTWLVKAGWFTCEMLAGTEIPCTAGQEAQAFAGLGLMLSALAWGVYVQVRNKVRLDKAIAAPEGKAE